MPHDVTQCPCCAAAQERKREQERFAKQPVPRLVELRADRRTLDSLYSSWICGTHEDGLLDWMGRENHLLRSSFRFRITTEQARKILSLSKATTVPPGIRDSLLNTRDT